jgi:DNA-binding IclR family transcriptional regulator
MARRSRENTALREFVLANVEDHPQNIVALAASRFGVTRGTAHRYVKKLVDAGVLRAEGATKARLYRLARYVDRSFDFDLRDLREEHVVWRDHVAPLLGGVADNVSEICQYGLSEMVNNVIDHSGSWSVSVHVSRTVAKISFPGCRNLREDTASVRPR